MLHIKIKQLQKTLNKLGGDIHISLKYGLNKLNTIELNNICSLVHTFLSNSQVFVSQQHFHMAEINDFAVFTLTTFFHLSKE